VQLRAFYILFGAVAQAPAGPTAQRSAQVNRLYNAIRTLLKIEGDERFLKLEGGSFTLEEAEIPVLQDVLNGFRNNVSGSGADALVWLDNLIATAPETLKVV